MSFDDSFGDLGGIADKDLQDFMQIEQQRMQFQQQVSKLTDLCWEKCVPEKPGSKLDSRTENCISNCVERFIDTSMNISQRFASLIQRQMQN